MKKHLVLTLIFLLNNTVAQTNGIKLEEIEKGTLYHKFTEAVAFHLNYYTTLTSLRAKTQNFLIDLDLKIRNHVQDLRFNDLHLFADAQKLELKNMFFSISDQIDQIFNAQDRVFLYTGEKMDEDDATIKEKEDFVKDQKRIITRQINDFIKFAKEKYKAITNIPKTRPTYSCYR